MAKETICNLAIQAYDGRDIVFEKTIENVDTVAETESESETDLARFFAEKECFTLEANSPYLTLIVKDIYNQTNAVDSTYTLDVILQFEVEE
jgi:hypothetical protein